FTFMGAHTIRQDDEFSGHVVEQTILCVVPALIKSVDMVTEIEVVIASFVTAFQHIPRHRRVRLFTTLSKTLNSEYYVHLILLLCGQQYATSFAKHKMGDCSALTDFSSSFLQNFQPEEKLDAIRKYLKLWSSTPDDLSDKDSAAYSLISSRAVFADILMFNKSQLF
ncbi:hypothetical protein OFN08_18375, partial [Acinetobacter baumannii]|nr:hypothetical protein [Acinetobacter baumannii]